MTAPTPPDTPPDTPLATYLKTLITQEGPITVERYMALALSHPQWGYYTRKDPFGAAGDFVTAPEISQMFGELIGLWVADVATQFAPNARLNLVELGPGRGTLMADLLRATQIVPNIRKRFAIHLVETSPLLAGLQQKTLEPQLAHMQIPLSFHQTLTTLPREPLIIIANEFFDALPVRYYQCLEDGWHERLVGLDSAGNLVFGLNPQPEPLLSAPAPLGTLLEINAQSHALMAQLATHLEQFGGLALMIDYGHTTTTYGESLQALRHHAYVHPLDYPGEADITTHVDFAALARTAQACGMLIDGPVTQGQFLNQLGLIPRANGLKRHATQDQARAIDAAVLRLAGSGPNDMGTLFKVMAVRAPELEKPTGFDILPIEIGAR